MTASSIAQYLDQKRVVRPVDWANVKRDVQPQPAPAAPAKARSPAFAALEARAAEPPPGFKRRNSVLGGATPEPAPEREQDYGPDNGEAFVERRGFGGLRPRQPPPPPIDIEAKLSEAYHRGVQEGLDAARNEAATQRAMERAELQKRAMVERIDFQMNEYAKLGEAIAQGFADIEQRIAEAVARILQPFLANTVAQQAVADLAKKIAKLTTTGHPPLLKIRGPEPLLGLLKDRLAPFAVEIEFIPAGGIEVFVEAQYTSIKTEIAPWLDRLIALQGSSEP